MQSAATLVLLMLGLIAAAASLVGGFTLGAVRAAASTPFGTAAADKYERMEGIYQNADGNRAVIMDLADQMPGGEHQLSVYLTNDGSIRTLTRDSAQLFSSGPSWFEPAPVERHYRMGSGPPRSNGSFVLHSGADSSVFIRIGIREMQVGVVSADGTRLAGALVLPEAKGRNAPFPAVFLIAGAGPLTRRTSRHMALQFAARGVAALIMDKRGTGQSGGNFRDATFSMFASDARAAYAALRAHPMIDSLRTGIMATSEGGLLAPAAARFDSDVAFFVCRVCPVLSYRDLLAESVEFEMRKMDASALDLAAARELMDAQARFAISGTGYDHFMDLWRRSRTQRWGAVVGVGTIPRQGSASWARFRELLLADPREMYLRMRSPALLIFGGDDPIVVAPVHAGRARALLSASPALDWQVRIVEDADHGLMRVQTDEHGRRAPITSYAGGWQEELLQWVSRRVASRQGPAPTRP